MLVKLPDGSLVEVTLKSKVLLASDVFGIGSVGPFQVVAFEGDLIVIELVPASEGQEAKIAPVDPGLIVAVDTPDEEKVEVKLPSGEVVFVPADLAPVLEAFIKLNADLTEQLAKIISGSELEALKKELEAKQAELDAQLKELLPPLEAASEALAKAVELLKAV
jgi:hypothetical protein